MHQLNHWRQQLRFDEKSRSSFTSGPFVEKQRTERHHMLDLGGLTKPSPSELLQQPQECDEPYCKFTERVWRKAELCAFTTECGCGKSVNYTDHVIRYVLLNGISNPNICCEVLGTKNIVKTLVNNVMALVENKEMARSALPLSTLFAVSLFKSQHDPQKELPLGTLSGADQTKQAMCPHCKRLFKNFMEGSHSTHLQIRLESGLRIRLNISRCSISIWENLLATSP